MLFHAISLDAFLSATILFLYCTFYMYGYECAQWPASVICDLDVSSGDLMCLTTSVIHARVAVGN